MRLRLEGGVEEIQETGELPAGALRIMSRQSVTTRSKLTGYQNIVMRIYPKGVTPGCFNRGVQFRSRLDSR
jgi:peroxiredoxin